MEDPNQTFTAGYSAIEHIYSKVFIHSHLESAVMLHFMSEHKVK